MPSHAIHAGVPVPAYILGSRHVDGGALIAIAVLIWALWFVVARRHWANIIETRTRLGYLAGDCALLAPGCVASGIGLLADQSWASSVLLLAVGAAAFDLTHTFIFLAEIELPKVHDKALPPWHYALVILVVLAVLGWIAWRDIWFATGSHAPWYLWVLSAAAAIVLVSIVTIGVRDARKPTPPDGPLSLTPPET